jgi:hypothetical protein
MIPVVLLLAACQPVAETAAPTPPAKLVEVVSINCEDGHKARWGRGTIRNTSAETLSFPRVFVQFDDGTVGDDITTPMTVPPGSLASFEARGGSGGCRVIGVQDNSGRSIL